MPSAIKRLSKMLSPRSKTRVDEGETPKKSKKSKKGKRYKTSIVLEGDNQPMETTRSRSDCYYPRFLPPLDDYPEGYTHKALFAKRDIFWNQFWSLPVHMQIQMFQDKPNTRFLIKRLPTHVIRDPNNNWEGVLTKIHYMTPYSFPRGGDPYLSLSTWLKMGIAYDEVTVGRDIQRKLSQTLHPDDEPLDLNRTRSSMNTNLDSTWSSIDEDYSEDEEGYDYENDEFLSTTMEGDYQPQFGEGDLLNSTMNEISEMPDVEVGTNFNGRTSAYPYEPQIHHNHERQNSQLYTIDERSGENGSVSNFDPGEFETSDLNTNNLSGRGGGKRGPRNRRDRGAKHMYSGMNWDEPFGYLRHSPNFREFENTGFRCGQKPVIKVISNEAHGDVHIGQDGSPTGNTHVHMTKWHQHGNRGREYEVTAKESIMRERTFQGYVR